MSGPLVAIYAGWFVWAIIWIAAARWSGQTERRPSRRENLPHKLVTIAGMAALLMVIPPRASIFSPVWRLGEATEWSIVALMASGFAFACWARVTMGALWSVRVERKENHQLIEHGPFGLVRHPIYTGLITAGLATALIKATPLAILGFVMTAAGLTLKARLEERFLSAELGRKGYDDYRRRVPMLVPFLPSGGSVAE
jgi:protein-S-isoprenylcysteine O-methyltransferase Ste14